MSDENDFDKANAPEWVKQLRKEAKANKQEAEQLRKQLAEATAAKRQSSVEDVLKAKGIDPSAAGLYNGEDVSEEAVGQWLAQYGKAFGVKQDDGPDPNAEAAQRVSDASYGNQVLPELPANGNVVGDHAELEHLMRTLSREELQKRGMLPKDSGLFGPRQGQRK